MPSSVASAAAMAEAMAMVSCVGPAEESAAAAAGQPAEGSAPQKLGNLYDARSGSGDAPSERDAWSTAWGDCAAQGDVWQGDVQPNFLRPASVGSGGGVRDESAAGRAMPSLMRRSCRSLRLRRSGLPRSNDALALCRSGLPLYRSLRLRRSGLPRSNDALALRCSGLPRSNDAWSRGRSGLAP